MKLLTIVGSVGIVSASIDGVPKGIDFNMTEAEWANSHAAFDRNMEEFEQGNYVPLDVVSNGFTQCDQECSNWCWATSATMVASHFTSISSGQCVSYEAKAASLKTGQQCDGSCSNRCDTGGQPEDMIQAISSFSGARYKASQSSLSQQELSSALQNGPVIFLISWGQGKGGHAITGHGVSGGQYQVHDPEGQEKQLSYNQIMKYQNGKGKWVETVYSSGGPGPSPGPPSPTPPGPSGCRDAPTSWQSSEGDSCQVYQQSQYCTTNGQPGRGWQRSWGSIAQYADRSGRSALDACCACGGGSGRAAAESDGTWTGTVYDGHRSQSESVKVEVAQSLGAYLASWVKAQEGKLVESGVSWDLADGAINHAKSAPQGGGGGFNITGSQTVDYKNAQPGDILQFVNYKEQTAHGAWATADNCQPGGIPAVCHTAVVVKSFDSASCGIEVEEQNWTKPVHGSVYHPCSKTGGSMTVTRWSASMMDETVVV